MADVDLIFSALPDGDPLAAPAGWAYGTAARFKLVSGIAEAKTFDPPNIPWLRFDGAVSPAAALEAIAGISGNAGNGDETYAFIATSSGNGYVGVLSGTFVGIKSLAGWVVGADIATGTALGVAPTTGSLRLRLDQTTHQLSLYIDATQRVAPTVDSTVTAGLAGGAAVLWGDSNANKLVSIGFNGAVTDTTAPIPTNATGAATGSRSVSGNVTVNEATGVLYSVLTTSATKPSKAQVKAGLNQLGAGAVYATSAAVASTGVKNVAASSGLTPKSAYFWHHMHEDGATNQSDVVSSGAVTTRGEITDIDDDNIVLQGQANVVLHGYFGAADPVVRIKSGSLSQQQVDTAHSSTSITLQSIVRGNLPYTDINHSHTIEVDTDE